MSPWLPRSESMIRRAVLIVVASPLLFLCSCATARDVPSPARGSIDHPLCSDGPAAQRLYLRRLRTQQGNRVEYTREDPVPGPDGHLLDPYTLRAEGALPWAGLMGGGLGDKPGDQKGGQHPVRVYMDMYRPGCVEDGTPPGFKLSTPD